MIEPYKRQIDRANTYEDVWEVLRALEIISQQLDYSTKMIEEINRPILEKLRPYDYPKKEKI